MKFAALTLVLTLVLTACDDWVCDTVVLNETVSPDSRYVATVFERNCGATTDYFRVVAVQQTRVLIAFKSEILVVEGQPPIALEWENAGSLKISIQGMGRISKQLDHWSDVAISVRQ